MIRPPGTHVPDQPAAPGEREGQLWYIYGVTTAAARLPASLAGAGDPPGQVRLVQHGSIAAITSPVPADQLGAAAALRAHARVVAAVARTAAVLPMRFGAALPSPDAVTADVLVPHHDAFAKRLAQLAGHDQYTVKGQYTDDAALREILAERPDIRRLREELRGRDLEVHRGAGIQLGELVARELERKQHADTEILTSALAPHAGAVARHETAGPAGAVNAAFLVPRHGRRQFEQAAEELGRRWHGRIRLRLIGPVPPYDFAQP
ncbi:MAG TPA: GvpL/GvpF family gas vesicle protein [Streptosporangiaceae bacterium]|nr:GvpL/GvpF family gas vesicle protein [Streptosporangiaceae bacterium]